MCLFRSSSQGRVLVTQWCRQSDGKGYPDFQSSPPSSPRCFHRAANVMGDTVMLSYYPLNAATTLSKSYSMGSSSQKTLRPSPQKYCVPPTSHTLESVGTQKWVFSPCSGTFPARLPFAVVSETARLVCL